MNESEWNEVEGYLKLKKALFLPTIILADLDDIVVWCLVKGN